MPFINYFVDLLQNQFDKNPDKAAIIHDGHILTFGQLEKRAKHVGALLQGKGLEKGDRVILFSFSFVNDHFLSPD